jgi:serine/threonine protein kinase
VSAVHYLHDLGLGHGDIKPENIVFDACGNAKLIGFGYCEDRIGTEEDKTGTLHYAAPEMLRVGAYNTHMADVWALGILLFVMETGKFPFSGNNDEKIKAAIREGRLLMKPRLEENEERLFRRMTDMEPKKRPTVAEILAMPWLAEV